ncbi:hypothetical protein ABZX65_24975 [Streptomyces sp. NPDC003300]|uniref:hypothetical protein n=2 Tax=unclassified Streptomyces TaxID=2593676 RepID=UPI0033A73BDE
MHREDSGQAPCMDFEQGRVWTEDPVGTPRMPDPVRAAAVRAVLIVAVALILAVMAVLLAAGHSWLSAPALISAVFTSVVATWAVLDVWVTRQVWNQRNGVLSSPSSAARALRRERRRRHRAARSAARGRPTRRVHIPRHLPWHLGV